MKKFLLLLSLVFVAFISIGADRSFVIPSGYTMPSRPIVLGASDTINASETITYTITNLQKYAQMQYFTIGLTQVDITPEVVITAFGKVTSTGAWVQIGSPITWTSASNNGTIVSTSPINYNYLKVTFTATSAPQQTKITAFEVKTVNAFEVPVSSGLLTIARPTTGVVTITSKDDDANAGLTVDAGGTGALILGGSTGTTAITSSDWAIGATGIATGLGAITSDGLFTGTAGATISGAAINLNASSNFATNIGSGTTNAAIAIGGGSNTVAINSTTWDVSTAGAITAASYNFGTAAMITGAADSIVFTNAALPTLAAGIELSFVAEAANTTAVRFDYNGTVKDLKEYNGAIGALDGNDIRSGQYVKVAYDGTQWVMISPSGN